MPETVRKLRTFLEEANNGKDAHEEGDSNKRRRVIVQPQADATLTFHDFRTDTILRHASFSFLGPASMAVYWFKIYLKSECFGWVHHQSPSSKDRRKKSHFCHIPGQYLGRSRNNEGTMEHNIQTVRIQQVLKFGSPGVHYAPSYVGIYNMIRKYGKFGIDERGEIVLVDYDGPALPQADRASN